nr:hypothetical protein [Lachnospiraceae bacterium]
LRDEIRAEQSKLKDKPFKDKWNYFWDYYKIHVIVGICLIFFVGTLIRDMANNKAYGFYALFLNATSMAEMEPYETEFAQIAGVDTEEYAVSIDNTNNVSEENYSELTIASVEKIMASVAAGEVDVFVSDQDTIRRYGYNSTLMNLNDILPASLLEKYADHLLYIDMVDVRREEEASRNIFAEESAASGEMTGSEGSDGTVSSEAATTGAGNEAETDPFICLYTDPAEMGEPVPVGIYLEDSGIIDDTQSYLTCTPVFSIVINTKHPAEAVQFLNYLAGDEPLTEDEIFSIQAKAALLQ